MEFMEIMNPSSENLLKPSNKIQLKNNGVKNDFKSFLNAVSLNDDSSSIDRNLKKVINEKIDKSIIPNEEMFKNESLESKGFDETETETEIDLEETNKEAKDLISVEKIQKDKEPKEMKELMQDQQLINEEILFIFQQLIETWEIQFNDSKKIVDWDISDTMLFDIESVQDNNETLEILKQLLNVLKQDSEAKQLSENSIQVKELLMEFKKHIEAEEIVSVNKPIGDTVMDRPKAMEPPEVDFGVLMEKEGIKKKDTTNEKEIDIVSFDGKEKTIPDIVLEKDNEENDFAGIKGYEEDIPIIDKGAGIDFPSNQKFETVAKQIAALKEDVFEQITGKIRLVSKEDFSEIKIQLKPENLGKLLLKIVLNKGEIIAKFTAENNHVKEIIESNFSELKGSLRERGINVHSLSVSVGNERKWHNNENNRRKSILRHKGLKSMEIEDIDYYQDKVNPYSIEEGILDIKV